MTFLELLLELMMIMDISEFLTEAGVLDDVLNSPQKQWGSYV